MASSSRSRSPSRAGLSLEEFLRLPEEKPYLEFIDGQVEAKVAPQNQHSAIQTELAAYLNRFARPARLGRAFTELRCTFAGRSIVPDVVFQRIEHIRLGRDGRIANMPNLTPDLHVEILSPGQRLASTREKLVYSMAHGCPLGWLVRPDQERVDVYRPGRPPEHLGIGEVLDGDPVLPGLRLPVAEVFGWLKLD